ncbi:MAG TPA: PHP-associated domain-containing protein [Terriglobia bacterium]|nr:PHP-associated domain-containing protein [Terriglobia bacterium]
MHVHSLNSGMCTLPVLRRFCRESYSPPDEVYSWLHRRGMDLVTLTDHDAIDGAETLRGQRDFFLSEEVTCHAPSGTEVHIGVYGMEERHHAELQRRRNDLPRLAAYLSEQCLFATVNHPFSALTGRRRVEDFAMFGLFGGCEVLNAHLSAAHRRLATEFAERNFQIGVGGSDAHTLDSVGSAWTEVPGARDREEFLAGLKRGRGRVAGRPGTYLKLTRDVLRISLAMMEERRWTRVLGPLLAAVPFVALANFLVERTFASKWSRLVLGQSAPRLGSTAAQSQESAA